MAEGFARAYGSDVLEPASAGLVGGRGIPPSTYDAMQEKNIGLAGQFPKRVDELGRKEYDLIVNMSGYRLPADLEGPVEEWHVLDPMGLDEDVFREVRDDIENRVMRLILRTRLEAAAASAD
jgi:protein-tyrosine-phosphatase